LEKQEWDMPQNKRKIHLACGANLLPGWENYDLRPRSSDVGFINLLHTFPFDNNSVDFIFFEHAVEHFDEVDGYKIMQEIHRVLKPGGIFRCSTPSLDTYIRRYIDWDSDFNKRHKSLFGTRTRFLNFAFMAEAMSGLKYMDGKFATNDGHKYIYSVEDLHEKLINIGFTKVIDAPLSESEFEELTNIDYRGRHGYPDNLDIILEATK